MIRSSDTECYQTRYSLLHRASKHDDGGAWRELVEIYQRFIISLLSRFGVSVGARDELVQEVIIRMWRGLEGYDPCRARFRSWLRAVARHVALSYFQEIKRRRQQPLEEAWALNRLESLPNSDLDAVIEEEWKTHLTELALERVRNVFSGQAIHVFLLSMQNIPAEEIARRHGLSIDSVYTLRTRVKTRMIREVRHLIEKLEI